MERNSTVRKVQEAPRFASVEALRGKRLIDLTVEELQHVLGETFADRFIEFVDHPSAEPPPEIMTRTECAKLLRISTAQLDILSRRDVDPIPFEVCGESRRYVRADVHSWLRLQRKAVR